MMVINSHLNKVVPPKYLLRPWTRHSLVLMVAGLVYVAIGTTFIITDVTPGRAQLLALALRVFPMDFWGTVWVLAGLLSMLSSRWPAFAETWGYMVLTGLSAGWSATCLFGPTVSSAPFSSGISQALSWGLVAFLWWAISGLVNPDRVRVVAVVSNDRR